MRVYIAGSYAAKARLRVPREQLHALGYDVLTTWLDEQARPDGMDQATFDRKLAIKDLVEAGGADLLIQDKLTPTTTGGNDVELGVALGRFQRQLIWLVGPRMSVFHQLVDAQFDTWKECIEHAKSIRT